jgi:hypothetical protein
MGIEPTYSAWKAEVLPLNYTRLAHPSGPRRRAHLCAMIGFAQLFAKTPLNNQPLRYSLVLVEGEGFEPSKA